MSSEPEPAGRGGGLLRRVRGTVTVLYREAIKFGLVGAVAFVIDLGLFNLLFGGLWRNTPRVALVSSGVAATIVSTTVATLFAWVANRAWTFRHRRNRPPAHEAALFFATNAVALVIGALCIAANNKLFDLEGNHLATNVAKVVGIGLGTLFRFWAYRRYVFAGDDGSTT